MVENSEKTDDNTKSNTGESKSNYILDLKGKMRKCIGSICFTTGNDGEIIVELNKSKEPECAELVAEYLLAKKRVRFNLDDEQIKQKD